MAAGKINLQKASGGITAITGIDGTGNTEVVLPESGELATKQYVDINSFNPTPIIATGTATFNSTTNNINLTGIGVGVEIGNVIQISGAEDAKNNSEFTIEVITDANNVIVNQAHANTGTTKNVANRASDAGVTVKLLAKRYNAPIGLGQGWVDLTSTRALGTTYTNSTGKSIMVFVTKTNATNTAWQFYINGVPICYVNAYGTTNSSSITVPNGSTYMAETFAGVLVKWSELR